MYTSMSIKPSTYQTPHTHCCNDVVPTSSLASQLRLPAADRPAAPCPCTRPSTQPTVDSLCQSSEHSDYRTRRGWSIRPLPTFCGGLYEYIRVDVDFCSRCAKAWRFEHPCASRFKRSAVWYFPIHWQWTKAEVYFQVFKHRFQWYRISQAILEFSPAFRSQHMLPLMA
jgi:hypothetical protein